MKYCLPLIVVLSIFTICLPTSAQHPDAVGIWLSMKGLAMKPLIVQA